MAHRRFPVRTGAKKRRTQWVGNADQGAVAIGANASVIVANFPMDGSAFVPEATIVRTRGIINIDQPDHTVDQDVIGAFGMAIVSDQAFAAGAASIPGPWTNSQWDGWFVHAFWGYHFEVISQIGILVEGQQIVIDSKAMRKFGSNETMVMVAESQSIAAEIIAPIRMLVKAS